MKQADHTLTVFFIGVVFGIILVLAMFGAVVLIGRVIA